MKNCFNYFSAFLLISLVPSLMSMEMSLDKRRKCALSVISLKQQEVVQKHDFEKHLDINPKGKLSTDALLVDELPGYWQPKKTSYFDNLPDWVGVPTVLTLDYWWPNKKQEYDWKPRIIDFKDFGYDAFYPFLYDGKPYMVLYNGSIVHLYHGDKIILEHKAGEERSNFVFFSPDGRYLCIDMTTKNGSLVHIYDLKTNEKKLSVPYASGGTVLKIDDQTTHFIAINKEYAEVHDIATGHSRVLEYDCGEIKSWWSTRDPRYFIVVIEKEGTRRYFMHDATKKYQRVEIKYNETFKPLSIRNNLFTAFIDGKIVIYDVIQAKPIESYEHKDQDITRFTWSSDLQMFGVVTKSGAYAYNVRTKEPFHMKIENGYGFQFGQSNNYFGIATDIEDKKSEIHVYDISKKAVSTKFVVPDGSRLRSPMALNHKYVVIMVKGEAYFYDTETGKLEKTEHDTLLNSRLLEDTNIGEYIVTKKPNYVNINSFQRGWQEIPIGTDEEFTELSRFSPSGKYAITSTKKMIFLTDMKAGKTYKCEQDPENPLNSFNFSAGDRFFIPANQKEALVYDLTKNFERVAKLGFGDEAIRRSLFIYDGRVFVIITPKRSAFYNAMGEFTYLGDSKN